MPRGILLCVIFFVNVYYTECPSPFIWVALKFSFITWRDSREPRGPSLVPGRKCAERDRARNAAKRDCIQSLEQKKSKCWKKKVSGKKRKKNIVDSGADFREKLWNSGPQRRTLTTNLLPGGTLWLGLICLEVSFTSAVWRMDDLSISLTFFFVL